MSGFDAPYEALFLLPEPLCKSCGTRVPPENKDCPQCGKRFSWSLREKFARVAIMAYISKEIVQQEAAAALAEFKARRWCKTHGFQRILPLEKNGVAREYCIKCIAHAMIQPVRPPTDYEAANNLCRGVHGSSD